MQYRVGSVDNEAVKEKKKCRQQTVVWGGVSLEEKLMLERG